MSNDLMDKKRHYKACQEKIDAIVEEAKTKKRELSPEDWQAIGRHTASAKVLEAEIQASEGPGSLRHALAGRLPIFDGGPLGGRSAAPVNGRTNRSIATVLREAMQTATSEEREQVSLLAGYIRSGITTNATADLTPGGDGGFLIPRFVQNVIERNYSQFDSMRSVSRRVPTDDGADFVFPVLSDSESAEQVASAASTGADATVSGNTPPTELTGPTLKAYKVSSKPVFIPRETSTDSDVDIIQEVIGALTARIIRFENARYTHGSGSGQASGFLTGATGFDSHSGVLDLDVAEDLAYSVPAIYRPQGIFMMSDATAKYLRKLKTGISGDKTQLWGDGNHTLGTPSTLHGWPVVINNDMTDVASDGSFSRDVRLPSATSRSL